jgi:hypothetical protein
MSESKDATGPPAAEKVKNLQMNPFEERIIKEWRAELASARSSRILFVQQT